MLAPAVNGVVRRGAENVNRQSGEYYFTRTNSGRVIHVTKTQSNITVLPAAAATAAQQQQRKTSSRKAANDPSGPYAVVPMAGAGAGAADAPQGGSATNMDRYLDDQFQHWTVHAGMAPPPTLPTTFHVDPTYSRRMSQSLVREHECKSMHAQALEDVWFF